MIQPLCVSFQVYSAMQLIYFFHQIRSFFVRKLEKNLRLLIFSLAKQEQSLFKRSAARIDNVLEAWQKCKSNRDNWNNLRNQTWGIRRRPDWRTHRKEKASPNYVVRTWSNLNLKVILEVKTAKNAKLLKILQSFLTILG